MIFGLRQVNNVTAYSSRGFVINGSRMRGAVALIPGLRLEWKVRYSALVLARNVQHEQTISGTFLCIYTWTGGLRLSSRLPFPGGIFGSGCELVRRSG